MTWNYRIIKRDLKVPAYFAIHEVFYDDKNKVTSWTTDPIDLVAESPKEIVRILRQMLSDTSVPVLIETELLQIDKNRSKIQFVQTCAACPEQYDAFLDNERVGYLRLRHGVFRVDYPDCGQETLYEARPRGDGAFFEDERDFYLYEAVRAIEQRLVKGSKAKVKVD